MKYSAIFYRDIFKEVFELSDDYDFTSLEYTSIDEWDSIGHMSLMGELEEKFKINIKTEDLIQFQSFTQGVEILKLYDIVIDLSELS